jgi:hypothetical protein
MAANYQQVFLAILRADASQAVTEFRKVEGQVEQSTASSASKFTQFSSLAKGALVGVGAAAAFSLGKTAVNAAVDLNESVNAVNVTFGNASDEGVRVVDVGVQLSCRQLLIVRGQDRRPGRQRR